MLLPLFLLEGSCDYNRDGMIQHPSLSTNPSSRSKPSSIEAQIDVRDAFLLRAIRIESRRELEIALPDIHTTDNLGSLGSICRSRFGNQLTSVMSFSRIDLPHCLFNLLGQPHYILCVFSTQLTGSVNDMHIRNVIVECCECLSFAKKGKARSLPFGVRMTGQPQPQE
jgi:hypothetical protein